MTKSEEHRRNAQEAFAKAMDIINEARAQMRECEKNEKHPSLTVFALDHLYDEVAKTLVRVDSIQAAV